MAKSRKCNPPKKVSVAATKLATSSSARTRSNAGRTLANHKNTKH